MTYKLVSTSQAVPAYDDRAGSQARSDIAALSDGGAIVVYTQTTRPDPDVYAFDYEMFAQRYDADGAALGVPVVVDTLSGLNTDQSSLHPVVTGLADGGYAVGWRDYAAKDAHVRSYDADGTMRGETIVNLPARDVGGGTEAEVFANGGGSYTINALDTGGFAFTWEASYPGILAQYGGAQIIYTQTFTDNGAAVGTPEAVTPWVGTGSYSVDRWNFIGDSVPLSDGRYIVFMRGGETAPGNTGEHTAILGRIFDANGSALTESFMINEDVDTWKAGPQATAMPDGGFVVTWRGGDVSGWRRFDADGDPVTGDMDLSASYADTNVVAMQDGGFLITARYVSSGSVGYTTYGQRIDGNNEDVGEPFVITSRRSPDYEMNYYHKSPDFVTLGNGKVMALIEGNAFSDEIGNDVLVQLYLPDALGTAEDDQLTAADGGTAIFGRAGDDALQGADGADYLDGEDGNDTVAGAQGDDTLVAGAGNDSLDGGAGDDLVVAGPGENTLSGGTGNDTAKLGVRVGDVTVSGAEDALVIEYEGSSNTLSGFETYEFSDANFTDVRTLAEVLPLRNLSKFGDDEDNTIYGDFGEDTLFGWGGNDSLFGEFGNDSLRGYAGDDQLNGGPGDDTLEGESGADELNGDNGNDMLHGGSGDDLLNGCEGDDVLYGDTGNDTLDGGEGDDRAEFILRTDLDTEIKVGGPDDELFIEYLGERTVVRNIETFRFTYVDFVNDDVIVELTPAQLLAMRDREVNGTDGNDVLAGDYGNDTIRGAGGADRIDGGAGNDLLEGGAGNDTLIGGAGDDTLDGGGGANVLNGTSGNNNITGGALSDTVYAGTADDTVHGGSGNDILWGMAGDDLFFGDLGSDTIVGAEGADTINGGGLSDEIHGGTEADFINGGWGYDRLRGGADADTFFHLGIYDHGSDWVQDYTAADGDVLRTGRAGTTAEQYLVQYAHTATGAGVRSGDADVMEAFVTYRPTGQILWALVDGAGQDEINLQAAPDLVFDIM